MHSSCASFVRRVLCAAFLLSVTSTLAAAQGSISGTVRSDTAAPLANVTVRARTSNLIMAGQATTDAAGNYTIAGLAVGPQEIYFITADNEDPATDWGGEVHPDAPCGGLCFPHVVAGAATAEPVLLNIPTRTGIDFQLAPAGRVAGTITGAGVPLAGVQLYAVAPGQAPGAMNQIATTDGSGAYALQNLPPGSYRVFTETIAGWVNEFHPDFPCVVACSGSNQSAPVVALALPGPAVADFDLAPGGAISGRVINGTTMNPISSVQVRLHPPNGSTFGTVAATDPNGDYTVVGIPPDSYFVSVLAPAGLMSEVYNDIQCPGSCSQGAVLQGTPIAVTSGVTATGKDFALTAGGRITGTVRNAATLAPIGGFQVRLFTSAGTTLSTAATTGGGVYTFNNLPSGSYYVGTVSTAGTFLNEIYPDYACNELVGTCQGKEAVANGTAIVVTAPAIVASIDLALDALGSISGTVTSSATAQGISGIPLKVFTSAGVPLFQVTATTSGSGVYTLTGLKSGSYYVATNASTGGWVNELYNNVTCEFLCDPNLQSATLVTVTAPGTTPAINFQLAQTGTFAGVIRDEVTLQPVRGTVIALTQQLVHAGLGFAAVDGSYSMSGLAPGSYYLSVVADGYFGELWDNVTCTPLCQYFLGTPTQLVLGTTTTRNFDLARAGVITGTIVDADSSAPLGNVRVTAVNGFGQELASAATNPFNGSYSLQPLPTGTVYLYTSATSTGGTEHGHEDRDNAPCVGLCEAGYAPGVGTPIAVTVGQTVSGRNFALVGRSHITGTVTDGSTGQPMAGVTVNATHALTQRTASATTNASGQYDLAVGPLGPYFLYTASTTRINEVHDNVPCGGTCDAGDWSEVTPVAITAPGTMVPGKDFSLDKGASLTGRVLSDATGDLLSFVSVSAVDSQGRFSFVDTTDSAGVFSLTSLNPGSYVLYTSGAPGNHGYRDEIYNNVACPAGCSATLAQRLGTRITLASGEDRTGVNMALSIGGRLTGRITDATTGEPLIGITIGAVRKAGTSLGAGGFGYTSQDGVFSIKGLVTGAYYLVTSNFDGYINEIYPGLACPGECDGLNLAGSPVLVTEGTTTDGVNLALERGGRISGRVTEAATSAPRAFAFVTVYNAQHRPVTGAHTDSNGEYLTNAGLPSGNYYLRVDAPDGFHDEVFDNLPCGDDCYSLLKAVATAVPVTAGSTATGKDFALDRAGAIRGMVTRQSDGVPVGGSIVDIFDSAGRLISYGPTGGSGSYVTSVGLAAGTYFAAVAATPGLRGQIYGGQSCAAICRRSEILAGTPITVGAEGTTTGIDFVLAVEPGVPGVPGPVRASNDERGVTVSWFPPSHGGAVVSYVVEAGMTPGSVDVSVPVAGFELLVPSLPPGTYYIRVRAINAAGAGPASAELVLPVGPGNLVPPAPPVLRRRRPRRPAPHGHVVRGVRRWSGLGVPGGSRHGQRPERHRHRRRHRAVLQLRAGAGRVLLPAGAGTQRGGHQRGDVRGADRRRRRPGAAGRAGAVRCAGHRIDRDARLDRAARTGARLHRRSRLGPRSVGPGDPDDRSGSDRHHPRRAAGDLLRADQRRQRPGRRHGILRNHRGRSVVLCAHTLPPRSPVLPFQSPC